MILSKDRWTINDKDEFIAYLSSFGNPSKKEWSRKILNTQMDVLVVQTKEMKRISNEIFAGNYESYLDLCIFDYYETIALYGMLIGRIKDFEEMEKRLTVYLDVMENWAHCDLLTFDINNDNRDKFIQLSNKYLKSEKLFVRRLGLFILLSMIKDERTLELVFTSIVKLDDEDEYYVIMMAGWLLSECIIRYEEKSIQFIADTTLNYKIVNKAIQKCRESRRVDPILKDELLKYKRRK